jgi:hypothetical protein
VNHNRGVAAIKLKRGKVSRFGLCERQTRVVTGADGPLETEIPPHLASMNGDESGTSFHWSAAIDARQPTG